MHRSHGFGNPAIDAALVPALGVVGVGVVLLPCRFPFFSLLFVSFSFTFVYPLRVFASIVSTLTQMPGVAAQNFSAISEAT